MELSVKGSGGTKSFHLSGVETSLTVSDLKKRCQEECGLSPDQQRLFLKGKLLKDEDTLEAAKISDKATLFLVKGASGSGAAKTDEAKDEKKEEEPAGPSVSCVAGCGFFGTAKTENYCSKCYMKKQQKEQDETDKERKERQEAEKAKAEGGDAAGADGEAKGSSGAEPEPERAKQEDKSKCWTCGKKCGLTGFECVCGYTFCSKHRYAEDHNCDFDHKGRGRDILAKNNPNISLKGGNGILDGI